MQGFGSGLAGDPNGAPANGTPEQRRARLLHLQDQIKVGLAGNLRGLRVHRLGRAAVTGAQVDYNGSPTGYTAAPGEAVTYVEAHDNETLYDALAYKLPQATGDGRPGAHADAVARHGAARPGHRVRARGRRAAAVEVARPQQLRLRRLVQPAAVGLPGGQRLRRRPAAAGRQRGEVAVRPAAARRPGAAARLRRDRGGPGPVRRAAARSASPRPRSRSARPPRCGGGCRSRSAAPPARSPA